MFVGGARCECDSGHCSQFISALRAPPLQAVLSSASSVLVRWVSVFSPEGKEVRTDAH